MTLSSLFLTAKFEFVIISRHPVVKKGSQKSSVPKEFILHCITCESIEKRQLEEIVALVRKLAERVE